MIDLIVNPKVGGLSWEEFCSTAPSYSVALDGYVDDVPKFDPIKTIVNFNHHSGVDRLATRATCGQVLMAIRQGMFFKFRDGIDTQARVFVNDCDEDVCTAWFLLHNHHLVVKTMNPLVNRLVAMEDALDATAGAYPFPADLPALKELAWIFQPYRMFRLDGGLDKRDGASFASIIVDVENRIMQHITGHGNSIPIDTRYEVMHTGNGWSMVKEIGSHARTGMFGDGIRAYVSMRERGDGKWTYTIGKLSPFIPFDLLKITEALNAKDTITTTDKWGGGNNIMGSPRVAGSSLDPGTLIKIIAEECK